MKLSNWLHRNQGDRGMDEFFKVNTTDDYDGDNTVDPYLNSLLATPTESIEGAHTRGYWEGRAEANPEYSVEIVRADDASIEEVLLYDATRALFHLERLDTDHWWLTLSPTDGWDEESTFDIFRVKKCIEVTKQ